MARHSFAAEYDAEKPATTIWTRRTSDAKDLLGARVNGRRLDRGGLSCRAISGGAESESRYRGATEADSRGGRQPQEAGRWQAGCAEELESVPDTVGRPGHRRCVHQ